jgi:hypothetical protein
VARRLLGQAHENGVQLVALEHLEQAQETRGFERVDARAGQVEHDHAQRRRPQISEDGLDGLE